MTIKRFLQLTVVRCLLFPAIVIDSIILIPIERKSWDESYKNFIGFASDIWHYNDID